MNRITYILLLAIALCACNRDDVIEQDSSRRLPSISFYNSTVNYATSIGVELRILPEYTNCADAKYLWTIDGVEAGTDPEFVHTWTEAGKYYVQITVTTYAGSAQEEVAVEVAEPGIPLISLPLASDKVTVLTGADFRLKADISNSKVAGFSIRWTIDGAPAGDMEILSFTPQATGSYQVEITASNIEGSSQRSFTIEAVDRLPIDISFPKPSYFAESTTRYTFAGRAVYLTPVIEGSQPTSLRWSINGEDAACTSETFVFTPTRPGEYTISVTADECVTASVTVVCVDATEDTRYRKASSGSSAKATAVVEWCPAPGQFIGDTSAGGGMTEGIRTLEEANRWALRRINAGEFVSLGAFGGYIIVGFDHSIPARSASYDFSIRGNAYLNAMTGSGGSNEPGIIYVMQDVNGNGLPDDEWYELRGSESDVASTWRDYAVSYYRPAGPAMNVPWTDNRTTTGVVPYMASFHRQPSYYPAWIPADCYTLRGTRLEARTQQDAITGMWNSLPYPWGYADNMGSDLLTDDDVYSPDGQVNGFSISRAMQPDGTAIELKYIDFIKVQTGVCASMAILGEVSTEVAGFTDLSLK